MDDIEYGRDKATIPLHGEINETKAERLVDALRQSHQEHFYECVEISVRSGGGQLVALREILHEVLRLRALGVAVETYVRGGAGSAAAFLAALGDRRRADKGSIYHFFHHTRLGDVGGLTALGATSAGRNLARWDANIVADLAQRGLRTTPPAEPDIEGLWGTDWHLAAKLVADTPLPLADEPDEARRQDLYERLRETVRTIVAELARPGGRVGSFRWRETPTETAIFSHKTTLNQSVTKLPSRPGNKPPPSRSAQQCRRLRRPDAVRPAALRVPLGRCRARIAAPGDCTAVPSELAQLFSERPP